jgi:hypothetical protein
MDPAAALAAKNPLLAIDRVMDSFTVRELEKAVITLRHGI